MKIVLLEPIGIPKEKLEEIRTSFLKSNNEFIWYDKKPLDDTEILNRIKDVDVVILSNLPISERVINSCNKLKMISVAFAGVDHIAMDICRAKGIVVCNAAGYSNHAVAELTIGMIISLYRKINYMDNQSRKLSDRQGFLGNELFGKTIGIVGTGNIGMNVAKLGSAFGCRIIVFSRTIKENNYIEYHDLDYVLKNSDIVSLHLPFNEKTKHLISKREFNLMKPEAILINAARGPIVNYKYLSEALKSKSIAGAAIDVYEKEPPLEKHHTLLDAPNTLLLPHIAYATTEAIKLRGNIVIDNINKWINGNSQNVIN
ncbi:MAG: NAD(P)-dependent oxidoreductase [Bacteroidales bacterium]|jgi:phosphoglycerate dehydrogenase-like enzyme|nr:NAD(P)-dependent oxidoreductase [Bacteroidales bacterium]